MKGKNCSKCGIKKTVNMFDNNPMCKLGVSAECKECQAERKLRKKRTKIGLMKDIYQSQRSNAKARGMSAPTYSKQELIDWAFSQRCFHEIFDSWKSSGYKKMERPSLDRLDNEKSYTLDNLRIVTWRENAQQIHKDQKSGKDMRLNKMVCEIDDEGCIIQTYHSARFAERQLGFPNDSIGKVCRGERKRACGKMFKYYEELMKDIGH